MNGPTSEVTTGATSEVTSEATSEVTSEVTTGATSEVTTGATSEVTSEVTTGATSEVTSEVTTGATSEVTSEATSEVTSEATSEVPLPQELWDYIFGFTDFETALKHQNKSAMNKFYNPRIHTVYWAIITGNLKGLIFLKNRGEDIPNDCIIDALWFGHDDVAEYLFEICDVTQAILNKGTIFNRCFKISKFFRDHGI
jgi:hypothetical protein